MGMSHKEILFSRDCARYPFRTHRKIAYINSSGICNLKCDYCFTNANKAPTAISRADMDFLFESFGERFLLCFSGQGDFFSGYKKSDRFLEHVLAHDVGVYLDFNGSRVQELLEIDGPRLEKIRHFDVSYHYETMKRLDKLDTWVDNVHGLSKVVAPGKWHVKAIMAMRHMEVWREKVAFYAEKVFPKTVKPLSLVLDDFDNTVHSAPVVKLVNGIMESYPEAVVQERFTPRKADSATTNELFTTCGSDELMCPSGSLYFKVGIDGTVSPCNKLRSEFGLVLGNLKKRQLGFLCQLNPCARLNGPGCLVNWERDYPQ